jgi:hypothetical protein
MDQLMCSVRCSLSAGIFDNEYAVVIQGEQGPVSLFAWKSLVKEESPSVGHIQAVVIEKGKEFDWVRLPSETFETGRNDIRVHADLVRCG